MNGQIIVKNWKTSVMAIIPILFALATTFGFINLEQKDAILNGVPVIFDSADSVLNEVTAVIELVTGIALLFAKDGDKSSKKLGLE